MLVLIPGITGHIGQHLARIAIRRGLDARGLGRSPNKLESLVKSESYYDLPALEAAVKGVDAIFVAYSSTPELQLDAQPLLLRAAERAGVRIFHALSWNYDWTKIKFGEHEYYDLYIAFRRQVELSSSIKPIYMFCGVFAEVLFGADGRVTFSPEAHGFWDPKRKAFEYYSTGDEKYMWTSEHDAAEFSIEAILSEQAQRGEGGFFSACSGELSIKETAAIYECVRGTTVECIHKGSVEDLERLGARLRSEIGVERWWEYIGAFYQLYSINGK